MTDQQLTDNLKWLEALLLGLEEANKSPTDSDWTQAIIWSINWLRKQAALVTSASEPTKEVTADTCPRPEDHYIACDLLYKMRRYCIRPEGHIGFHWDRDERPRQSTEDSGGK